MQNNIIPNTTQIPNLILDEVMPQLSDTEFRVLMVICRQTLGWIENRETGRRKEKDWISYSQLIEKTGRSREAIAEALKSLREKHLIETYDQSGNLLSREDRLSGCRKLYYRLSTSGVEKGKKSEKLTFKSQESRLTKETLTKENTLPYGNGGATGLSTLASVLEKKKIRPTNGRSVLEWQDVAIIWAKNLGLKLDNTGLRAKWMRFFKMYYPDPKSKARLSAVYAFMADYPKALGEEEKIKLFFWRFYHNVG